MITTQNLYFVSVFQQNTYKLLKRYQQYRTYGNMRSRDILSCFHLLYKSILNVYLYENIIFEFPSIASAIFIEFLENREHILWYSNISYYFWYKRVHNYRNTAAPCLINLFKFSFSLLSSKVCSHHENFSSALEKVLQVDESKMCANRD